MRIAIFGGSFNPPGLHHRAIAEATRKSLREVETAETVDAVDEVTKAAMIERHSLDLELHDAGESYAELNNLASPLQSIRAIFDLMPTATEDDWATIAARMAAVPAGVDGYIASLRVNHVEGPTANPAIRRLMMAAISA